MKVELKDVHDEEISLFLDNFLVEFENEKDAIKALNNALHYAGCGWKIGKSYGSVDYEVLRT